MNKIDFKKVAKTVERFTKKNSPALLTGVGIAGMLTTVVLTGKATVKAIDLIHEREVNESKPNLTKKEVVQTVWKEYVPVIVTGGLSIACVIGANSVSARRNAALATAYKITETAFADYKEQVVATVGEKKEKLIEHKVNEKKVKEHPVPDNQQLIIMNEDEQLCYDTRSDRYFKSTKNILDEARNNINRLMLNEGYISLNEAYSEMHIPPLPDKDGDYIGWNIDNGQLDFRYGSAIAPNGKPCLTVSFDSSPKCDFNMYG